VKLLISEQLRKLKEIVHGAEQFGPIKLNAPLPGGFGIMDAFTALELWRFSKRRLAGQGRAAYQSFARSIANNPAARPLQAEQLSRNGDGDPNGI
jgi:hypothetical protein